MKSAFGLSLWCLLGTSLAFTTNAAAVERAAAATPSGRELFTREWVANDSRAGGDGLGPMFNESSCVGCHNQGGVGGGGPESKNVAILTVLALSSQPEDPEETDNQPQGLIASTLKSQAGRLIQAAKSPATIKAQLKTLHPNLTKSRSTVLHRFSTDSDYAIWRRRFENPHLVEQMVPVDSNVEVKGLGLLQVSKAAAEISAVVSAVRPRQSGTFDKIGFAVSISQRNTTALYGAGLIDSIPDEVLKAAAQSKHENFPEISGRVAKLSDNRIGKFGWKAQHATLKDFTLTACAVEIGLDVPDHPQGELPHKARSAEKSHDMTDAECQALIEFVGALPRPVERAPAGEAIAKTFEAGRAHFNSIGCGACHSPKLGKVDGLYSDLLLHDMGRDLGDMGAYGGTTPPNSSEDADQPLPLADATEKPREPTAEELAKTVGALRQEWRTPPLWGFRDSAPYLHDGRAANLDEAVALHGGEARHAAIGFFALSPADREQVQSFLKSLTAPGLE